MKKTLCFLILLQLLLYSSTVLSQEKVVVIPLNSSSSSSYTGLSPINVDNTADTIGLSPGTNPEDLMTWDGNNWVAAPPAVNSVVHNNMQPYLGIYHAIALVGIFPARNMSAPFIGQINMIGFNFPPRGWALCDGQLLSISSNSALFSLLGTTYGGNGRTTFGLPDLRGRVPVHVGTGPGLPQVRWGEKAGSRTLSH